MLFLRLPSFTCLLRAVRLFPPFLPRWLHAISTGLLRAPLPSSRRYIWRRYNENAISSAALFHLPPSSTPFLSPFSAEVAPSHLHGTPKSPPAVLEEVHLEGVQ